MVTVIYKMEDTRAGTVANSTLALPLIVYRVIMVIGTEKPY